MSIATGDTLFYQNAPVYDLATGKQLGTLCGYPKIDESGYIAGGKMFNSADGTVWTFNGKGKKPTAEKAGEIVITRKAVYRNHSGAIDLTVDFCNNTGKKIKNIIFTVYAVDAAGNKVRDDAKTEFNFYIQDSSTTENGKLSTKEWWSIVKNQSAADVIISAAQIEFSDGSKKTLSSKEISQIF